MNPAGQRHYDFTLRRENLAALIFLCVLAAAAIGEGIARGRREIGLTVPAFPDRVGAADEKIDPNTAPVASLMRLRGIGRAKADAIVAYRKEHGRDAFQTPDDLARVHGIGPAIVRRARDHLLLPARDNSR